MVGKVDVGESCYPRISYKRDGRETEFTSKYGSANLVLGRSSHVYYCPSCMESEEHQSKGRFYYSFFTGIIGTMILAMGLIQLL